MSAHDNMDKHTYYIYKSLIIDLSQFTCSTVFAYECDSLLLRSLNAGGIAFKFIQQWDTSNIFPSAIARNIQSRAKSLQD